MDTVQPSRGVQQPPRGLGQARGGNCMDRGQRAPGKGTGHTEVRQPTLVYAARHRDDGDTPDVITDTFFIRNVPYTTLIDVGSTYSYIVCIVSETLGIMVESTTSGVTVLSPLGQSVRVDKLFRDVPLEAKKLVYKGYEAYLAYIDVSNSEISFVRDIRTVKDFSNVFPDELFGLPPDCEVEFEIELLPGTASMSIAPYRMAPKEIVELKAQIQELLDRGFI
ncbi:uncharacterized protein LOC128282081 [Gossypium arboreum]|uniref:uncharacterized protein LOC128282081 n=1 Tax=Gossypium arboreum TaxID=29729 RepID=UPI0022F171A6|nr:uncharacterized protein LOC128282081 [Gossypium arboreum]